jgi:hypothetical protein
MATRAYQHTGSIVANDAEPIFIERRSESRRDDLVDRAILCFRGGEFPVRVLDISSRGTMIESDLAPRLGENVVIRFDGCSPIQAFARWCRDGCIGLKFGGEMILG